MPIKTVYEKTRCSVVPNVVIINRSSETNVIKFNPFSRQEKGKKKKRNIEDYVNSTSAQVRRRRNFIRDEEKDIKAGIYYVDSSICI